jgi:hypothetical protein
VLDLFRCLPAGAASLSMPFKFAYVLSRGFGQHSAALALLRSGVGAATSRVLSQAIAAMDIRLACQQLTEAYLEVSEDVWKR